MNKKLMNEQLPTPVIASKDAPRERVLRHMRNALAAGASFTLAAGCTGFGVVDPIPPPAQCRTMKAPALITAKATVESMNPLQMKIELTVQGSAGLTFLSGAIVTGGVLTSQIPGQSYRILPDSTTAPFDFVVRATCNDYSGSAGPFDIGVKITVDPTGATMPVVTQVAPPTDGGTLDGG